jgi:hypothetical protein
MINVEGANDHSSLTKPMVFFPAKFEFFRPSLFHFKKSIAIQARPEG